MKFIIDIKNENLQKTHIITKGDIAKTIKEFAKEKEITQHQFKKNWSTYETPKVYVAPLKVKTKMERVNKAVALTTFELAKELGVTTTAINQYIKQGIIKYYKLPSGHKRIPIDEVEQIKSEVFKIYQGDY